MIFLLKSIFFVFQKFFRTSVIPYNVPYNIYIIIRCGISIWCIPFIKEMQISNNLKKICLVEKFTDTGHKCHSVTFTP